MDIGKHSPVFLKFENNNFVVDSNLEITFVNGCSIIPIKSGLIIITILITGLPLVRKLNFDWGLKLFFRGKTKFHR